MRIHFICSCMVLSLILIYCTDQEAEKRIQAAEERALAAEKRAAIAEERLLMCEKSLSDDIERAKREAEAKKSTYKKSDDIGISAFKTADIPISSLVLYVLTLACSSIACIRASRAATVCERAFSAAILAIKRPLS